MTYSNTRANKPIAWIKISLKLVFGKIHIDGIITNGNDRLASYSFFLTKIYSKRYQYYCDILLEFEVIIKVIYYI